MAKKRELPRDPRGENEQAVRDGWGWIAKAIRTPPADRQRVDEKTSKGRKPKNARGKK